MSALDARFRVPRPRRALVDRARLLHRLSAGTEFPPRLVLVAAPAGFGKTTLLAQWLTSLADDESPPSVAWVPIEGSDADPTAFVTTVTTSVHHTDGTTGGQAVALLAADRSPLPSDVLAMLVNELEDVPGSLVIALDDYHAAASPEVDQLLAFLVDHLPPRVTVAITTRADPALPLARLRSRGELVEIRAADLRFTTEEADAFLTGAMGLRLEAGQIEALGTRTEGWAAGLQLAALSARSRADEDSRAVERFIADFTGTNRFILDYLVEEVLQGEDEATRGFLLHTSVLDRLTGPLCAALTQVPDGHELLAELERRNLFVVPLDDSRTWYRYHHLFADVLRARLLAASPDSVAELHGAAADWYAAQGMLDDAVRHAREAADPELLADLIEAELPALRKHRQDRTIIDRLSGLGEHQLESRPLLATFKAWTHLANGDLDGVDRWLTVADQAVAAQRRPLRVAVPAGVAAARDHEVRIVPATVAIYRASLAQARGESGATAAHAARAKDLADPQDHLVHAAAVGFLGLAAWSDGDLLGARALFEETRNDLVAAGNTADALATTVPVAAMTVALGEPARARQMFEQALVAARAHQGPMLSSHADLYVGLADLLCEGDDLTGAAEHLQQAYDLGEHASLPENRFRADVVSSDVLAAAGDLPAALEALDHAREIYLPGFFPDIQPLAARRARLVIRFGRLDSARTWARERALHADDTLTYRTEYEHLTLARLLLAGGPADAHQALQLLDRLHSAAHRAGRTGSVVETLVLRALARHALGHDAPAIDDLAGALSLGVPAGYRRLFLDEGDPIRDMLAKILEDRTRTSDHAAVRDLLGTAHQPRPVAVLPLQLAAEPLSARELEVLRLLGGTLTGPEIARELYISLNTFRTHTKHIFLKLDVTTRRAAVARAAELGL